MNEIISPPRSGGGSPPEVKPDDAFREGQKSKEAASGERSWSQDTALNNGSCGFRTVLIWCIVLSGVPCAVVSIVLSSMGFGEEVYEYLGKHYRYCVVGGMLLVGILAVLYVMDYFMPPHMPNKHCVFSENDRVSCGIVASVALLLMFASGLFAVAQFPWVPITMSILCGPLFLLVLRYLLSSRGLDEKFEHGNLLVQKVLSQERRRSILDSLRQSSSERRTFYGAAMVGFGVSGALQILVWVFWAMKRPPGVYDCCDSSDIDYLLWMSPLMVGVGNLFFASVLSLRVRMASAYDAALREHLETHINKVAQLDMIYSSGVHQHLDPQISKNFEKLAQELSSTSSTDQDQTQDSSPSQQQRVQYLSQVSWITKVVGCSLLLSMAVIYAGSQLLAADGPIANLLLSILWVFLMVFNVFVVFSFWNLVKVAKDGVFELPMWRMAKGVAQNDWARATLLTSVLPLLPGILLLSMVNQQVRKCRSLYHRIPPEKITYLSLLEADTDATQCIEREATFPRQEISQEPLLVDACSGDQPLTTNIRAWLEATRRWNWISIIEKMYIVGFLFAGYTLTARLLNIFLAWLIEALGGMSFDILVVCTFICGITCFLLPPVPGVPVYLFAGLVLAEKHESFLLGCTSAVATGFVLKLAACAIQQKIIGGTLGYSTWIKSQVGVHTPLVRAIERILSQPGLSVGKVAIACGGPDWPTSVLAGLLNLSLFEMEMATVPIIVFVTPCTLSGSFYLKAHTDETWNRWSNLMLQFSVAGAVCMQLTSAWAVQDTLDRYNAEVSKPLAKNLHLDWLDYRCAETKKGCATEWAKLPTWLQVVFVAGMLLEVAWAQVFYWMSGRCFGDFAVTSKIATLKLYGADGLVKPMGLLGMCGLLLGGLGWWVEQRCVNRMCREDRRKTAKLLLGREALWKKYRLSLARTAQLVGWPLPVPLREHRKMDVE